jgi:hypothetical protein
MKFWATQPVWALATYNRVKSSLTRRRNCLASAAVGAVDDPLDRAVHEMLRANAVPSAAAHATRRVVVFMGSSRRKQHGCA